MQDFKIPCSDKLCQLHVQSDPDRRVANHLIVERLCLVYIKHLSLNGGTLSRRWSDNATNEVQTPNLKPVLSVNRDRVVTSRVTSLQSSPGVAVSVLFIVCVTFVLTSCLSYAEKIFFVFVFKRVTCCYCFLPLFSVVVCSFLALVSLSLRKRIIYITLILE